MHILFLSKRRPQNKDLIDRPYGRFYYLPYWLAKQGHTVTVMLLSYQKDDAIEVNEDGITWISESIYPWGPLKYIKKAHNYASKKKPDWVVGFSDTYYGILAEKLANKYQLKSCIDAYDNYESYISWGKPLHWIWRRALSKATMISSAGEDLGHYMTKHCPEKSFYVVPMAADPEYEPKNKEKCKQYFNLPIDKKIIGYSGSLYSNRGIRVLFEIVNSLHGRRDILFVLSGRKPDQIQFPENIIWMGYLPDQDMPKLINAIDLLLVLNKPSSFGNFSYPIKLYEAMACKTIVVASDVPGTRSILRNHTALLAKPLDKNDFINKIEALIKKDRYDYTKRNTWKESGLLFEKGLLES